MSEPEVFNVLVVCGLEGAMGQLQKDLVSRGLRIRERWDHNERLNRELPADCDLILLVDDRSASPIKERAKVLAKAKNVPLLSAPTYQKTVLFEKLDALGFTDQGLKALPLPKAKPPPPPSEGEQVALLMQLLRSNLKVTLKDAESWINEQVRKLEPKAGFFPLSPTVFQQAWAAVLPSPPEVKEVQMPLVPPMDKKPVDWKVQLQDLIDMVRVVMSENYIEEIVVTKTGKVKFKRVVVQEDEL